MALDFPNNPVLDQTYTVGDLTWKWNGFAWDAISTTQGPQGSQGPQGPTGPIGYNYTYSDSPPVNPAIGDRWVNNSSGQEYTYVNDGNSSQWVETRASGFSGAQGPQGSQGSQGATGATGSQGATGPSPGSAARPLLTDGAYLDGSTGLVLSGLASNYASAPDTAALSITGDIDIKVKMAATSWKPSNTKTIVGKWLTTGNQLSYVLYLLATGGFQLDWSTDGSTTLSKTSNAANSFTDGAMKWVRVTMRVNDGAGNRVTKFYTSDDGATWTQLGTTDTTAGTTSIFDSTASLNLGSKENGNVSSGAIGTVARVIIQSAYDTADNTTSLAFDANFASQTADALAFTESSSNSATVTVNTTRYSYGVPGYIYTATSTSTPTANTDRYWFFQVQKAIVMDMWGLECTSGAGSNVNAYIGIYSTDDNFQPTGTPLLADTQVIGAAAFYRKQIVPITLQPGVYALGLNFSGAPAFRHFTMPTNYLQTAIGSSPFITSVTVSRTAATFPTNPTAWNSTGTGNTTTSHWAFLRWKAA